MITVHRYSHLLVLFSLYYYNTLLKAGKFKEDIDSFLNFINQDKKELYDNLCEFKDIENSINNFIFNYSNVSAYFIDKEIGQSPHEAIVKSALFYLVYIDDNVNKHSLIYKSFKNSILDYIGDFHANTLITNCNDIIEDTFGKPLLYIEEAILWAYGYNFMLYDISKFIVINNRDYTSIKTLALEHNSLLNIIDKYGEPQVKPKEYLKWALNNNFVDLNINFFKKEKKKLENTSVTTKTKKQKKYAEHKHCTELMNLMNLAVEKFWVNYNIENPPMKKQVVDFLLQEAEKSDIKLSNNIAEAIDSIIRHPNAKTGGLRKIKG